MFCQACNSDSGPSLFCNVCDLYLPTRYCGVRAGVARRLCAFLADLFIVAVVVALALLSVKGFAAQDGTHSDLVALCWVLSGLVYLVAFFRGLSVGQTLGKALCNLRVVDKRDGSVPGIGRMLLRETLGKWVSGLFFSLGYFWAIWDRDGQTWHDKIAGTVVLHEEQSAVAGIARPESPKWWTFAEVVSFLILIVPVVLPPQSGQGATLGSSIEASTRREVVQPSSTTEPTVTQDVVPQTANDKDGAQAIEDSQSDVSNVTSAISGWASALAQNDANAAASYYAESVSRYFLQRDVTREFVKDDKQSFLDSGKRMQSFTVGDLQFENNSSDTATVLLTKNWFVSEPAGSSGRQGATRSRLWLQRTSEGWKITGEQDLK